MKFIQLAIFLVSSMLVIAQVPEQSQPLDGGQNAAAQAVINAAAAAASTSPMFGLINRVVEKSSPLSGIWVFDPTESCGIYDPLSKNQEEEVHFCEDGLVRSNFLPRGQWSYASNYLTIHNQTERDRRYHLQLKKIDDGSFFTIDSAGFSDAPLQHISRISGQKNVLLGGNPRACVWSFYFRSDWEDEITIAMHNDHEILFNFWKHNAGKNKVQEWENRALSDPNVLLDILESPFKFMQPSAGKILRQRMIGTWYSKDSIDNETILLTKNRPKVPFEGLRIWSFNPDSTGMLNSFILHEDENLNPLIRSMDEITWHNDTKHKFIIINGIDRKVAILPNGDVVLTPLSTDEEIERN